ncbi:trypco2 family protein [Micromonospora chokoriensis]
MDTKYLPLSQAIGELRTELLAAIDKASGEDLKFAVNGIEVELQVVATTTLRAETGGSLWGIITAKGAAEYAGAATHKVTLSLKPRSSSPNEEVFVSDPASHLPE